MKFNQNKQQFINNGDVIRNYEGEVAYKTTPENELFLKVASCFYGNKKFYETSNESELELKNAIKKVMETNPEFVLKLAYFAREVLHLRSVPLVLLVEYANLKNTSIPGAWKYVSSTIQRADEITEILAYQLSTSGNTNNKANIPMMIKNGVADAFNKFDEYQFAKYRAGNRKNVTFKDALRITHPKPINDNMSNLFAKIIADELEIPKTWETYISMNGSTQETWNYVMNNYNVGIFAQVRNLRNLLKNGADISKVIDMLSNPMAIKRSKMYPFRFYTAYKEIDNSSKMVNMTDVYNLKRYNVVKDALNNAMELSVDNIPKFDGNTLVAIDNSASMTWSYVSNKNKDMTCNDIATLFGAMANKIFKDTILVPFASTYKVLTISKNVPLFTAKDMISKTNVGGGTIIHGVMEFALKANETFDRIIFFTDEMGYNDVFINKNAFNNMSPIAKITRDYMRERNKNVKIYVVNLCGYPQVMYPKNMTNVVHFAGWSEKIFDFMKSYEMNGTTMVNTINNITI